MNIVICGGREYDNYLYINYILDALLNDYPTMNILESGDNGAAYIAQQWAINKNVPVHTFENDFNSFDNATKHKNKKMLKNADVVIAFPGGYRTHELKNTARQKNIKVIEM